MERLRLGVLVSGSGTNLQAILDAVATDVLPAEVRLVLSNRPGVRALERAAAARVPSVVLSHRDYPNRADYDAQLVAALRQAEVEWVVLAGFLRVLSPVFLQAFPGRIVNIHPSLLPAFPGVHAQQQAFDHGVKVTGCTVHFVNEGLDAGPIIAQRAVPVVHGDTVATLTDRILEQEHLVLVEVLRHLAAGKVVVEDATADTRARVRVEL